MSYGFHLVVEGDYACFTRSEAKVERASYDVPTPGALEGLLKSIYWKPALQYYIDRIVVFHPIQFTNIRRNEVKRKVSLSEYTGIFSPVLLRWSRLLPYVQMILEEVCQNTS